MATRKIKLNELRNLIKQIIKEEQNDEVMYDLSPKERRARFINDMNDILSDMDGINDEEKVEWVKETVAGYDQYLKRLKNAEDHGFDWKNS